MKKFFAIRPCSFGGRKFFTGEEIPAAFVNNAEAMKKYGVISVIDGDGQSAQAKPAAFAVTIGGKAVDITEAQLQEAVNILTADSKAAVDTISGEIDAVVLDFIKAADTRKNAREAAEKQLAILTNLNGAPKAAGGYTAKSEASGEAAPKK